MTIIVNLLGALIGSGIMIFRAIWHPLSMLKPIWKCEIWERPRTASDAHNKLD